MTRRFTATAAFADEIPSLGTLSIVVTEHADRDGARLELHQALSFDEQDRERGLDTYCVVNASGGSHYGGVQSWSVRDGRLELELTSEAAQVLETDVTTIVDLAIDDLATARLTAALRRLLGPAAGEPELESGLREVVDVEVARREAERAGYTTIALPATGVVDRESFFDAVRATLPLDPPIQSARSWDALSDSLWEGLHRNPAARIAIVWPNAHVMSAAAPVEFEIAVSVLADVASLLANVGATCGRPKQVAVFVERPGPR